MKNAKPSNPSLYAVFREGRETKQYVKITLKTVTKARWRKAIEQAFLASTFSIKLEHFYSNFYSKHLPGEQKEPQETPNSIPRAPTRAPNTPSRSPKDLLRDLQETRKKHLETSKRLVGDLQETSGKPPRAFDETSKEALRNT